jgi:murein DD-endopeptidase MepM/ murein hydrolase activator NlpD
MKLYPFFLLLFCSSVIGQVEYPRDYFRSPLEIPMKLAGNFGELRPNHFHAGFDFRTNQKEGQKVFAVADGYISRIKISTFGNGKAIYIDHPNGFTSVYGHLQRGSGVIEEYIKKAHYKEEAYEIEIFPLPGELMVKKGDTIALSGNTGSSEGPHLHFEIRDTKTEKIINPYLFGFDFLMQDSKKPIISSIMVYPIDENSVVNQSKRPVAISLSLQKDGTYLAESVSAKGNIGFGILAYDLFDNSYSKHGVYSVKALLNGNNSFSYEFNTISFDEMRYINIFIDYPRYKRTKQRIQKLFMKKPFPLSIIQSDENNGVINIEPNLTYCYQIEVADFYGNMTKVTIPIHYSLSKPIIGEEMPKTNYFVRAETDANFEKDNCSVFFPAGTFYDDFYLDFEVKNNRMTVHNNTIPVFRSFLVTIKDSTKVNDGRTFIGSINGNKISYNPTTKKLNTYTAYSKDLGDFALVRDTLGPKVTIAKPIENKWISSQKTIQLTINDTLSGIRSYNGYLNGKWILFEYDNKTKKITHHFDDGIVADGKNDLKVVVTDNVGNSTIFETQFFRSQKK